MARHSESTRRRLAQTASRLSSLVYSETIAPSSLAVSGPTGREGWAAVASATFEPAQLGQEFGPQWATYWFRVDATVPGHWAGERVDLIWDSGSEASLWRSGHVRQGLYSGWRALRTSAPVADPAAGGEELEMFVEMACNEWAGDDPEPAPGIDRQLAARYRLGQTWTEARAASAPAHRDAPARLRRCELGRFDPIAWRLARELELLRLLELEMHDLEPDWQGELVAELDRFSDIWRVDDRSSWEPAGEILAALLDRRGPVPRHRTFAVGHAHIDTAWVWPVAETRRKIVRSTANQLELMERYPRHRFAASSAQHYAWLEEDAPDLFERVRREVEAGRWEPVGGAWVEPDCNLPAGESLIRQLLFGQRYFERALGRRARVYWSPDTFGHNGQMPQILRQFGIDRFLTQKLSWNQFTHPPHNSFRWRGIDGSEVLAHLPPVGTYNAELTPNELRTGVNEFRDHDRSQVSLVLFGHGDGGGGPTAEMLEWADRIGDLRGLPQVEVSESAAFFDRLEAEADRLGVISGQLYFEYHRGTYTSQARTKRGNRRCERALHEAEAASAIAWWRGLAEYPKSELDELWPTLLRNQFHDILPGTSLREVHELTEAEHAELERRSIGVRDAAIASLPGSGAGAPLNLDGFARREVVEAPDGPAMFESPALGFGTAVQPRDEVCVHVGERELTLANGKLAATFDARGAMTSLRMGGDGREALAAPANVFELHEDRPTAFDAWELEPYHDQTREVCAGASGWEVTGGGPLRREVVFRQAIGAGSSLVQTVRLDAESERIEFRCDVDWRERHKLLRVTFPIAAAATTAIYGAPFGVHELSTHANTDADLAHFEAPALGFVELGEHGFGAAVLSSTNHGFSVRDGVISISLLRAPTDPDPEADQGDHRLAFALQPHQGSWQEAGIARAAIAFDTSPAWVPGAAGDPGLSELRGCGLILDTIKRSEDGDALVLRFYEPHGGRGRADLRLPEGAAAVWRTDGLEEAREALEHADGIATVPYGPFEIVTLLVERAGR